MAIPSLKSYFKRRLLNRKSSQTGGFTLTELLVSIIVGSIIVTGLLYLVVELLQTDARESARNETQREMQMATDYIASDLREAVYVYPNAANLSNYINFGNHTPVLALWKPEPLKSSELPADCTTLSAALREECSTLKVRRSAYSLIVYLQSTENPNGNWSGRSRILRYRLPKYTNSLTLDKTSGYVDPVSNGLNFAYYTDPPTGITKPALGTPPVLVDFVDAPNNPNPGTVPVCDAATGYTRTPAADATPTSNSFFACVRNSQGADASSSLNQDVQLYLRGNVNGRGGGLGNVYFPVQTQVLVRGVINKVPFE